MIEGDGLFILSFVFILLSFSFIYKNVCIYLSLWLSVVFVSAFLHFLLLLYRWVGEAESVSGVTSLIAAIPVGIAVDRYNRRYVCWVRILFHLFYDHIVLLLLLFLVSMYVSSLLTILLEVFQGYGVPSR